MTVEGNIVSYCGIIVTVATLLIGMAYDVFGRRKPLLIAYFLTSAGLFMIPWGKGNKMIWSYYLIARFFVVSQNITLSCPFVPDLVLEQSHGLANCYVLAGKAIGVILS